MWAAFRLGDENRLMLAEYWLMWAAYKLMKDENRLM